MSIGKGIGGHQAPVKGATDEWLTPPEIIQALGAFDLDPCSPVERPWPTAAVHYTKVDDGLLTPWDGRAWVNPPYGPQTKHWLERLADHGDGVGLIFARTETKMFHDYVWKRATGIFFFEGRLHFHYPDGNRAEFNAGGPSCLVAYGQKNELAILSAAKLKGHYVKLQ